MTSIPQLREDINVLRKKLFDAQKELAKIKSNPPKAVETRTVVMEIPVEKIVYVDRIVTVPVDNPDHIAMIRKLQSVIKGNS